MLAAVATAAESLLRAASWQEVIDDALAALGAAVGASRAYLFEFHRDRAGRPVMSQRYEWCAPGIRSQLGNPDLKELSRALPVKKGWQDDIDEGRPVQAHVCELEQPMRSMMEAQEIRSFLGVPIFASDRPWGFVGFDACDDDREWGDAEIEGLRAAAGILGAAIQRHEAEAARREAEARYRTLVEHLPLTVYIDNLDDPASSLYISPQVERSLGYSPEEWLADAHMLARLVHPDDHPEIVESPWPEEDGPHRQEYRMIARDGRVVWMQDEYVIIRDDDGNRRYAQGYLLDTTERREMEEALRDSEQQFRAVFDSARDAIVIVDDDLRCVDANPAAAELVGRPRHELIGARTAGFAATPGRGEREVLGRELLERGELTGTIEIERADGTQRIVEYAARAHFLPGRHLLLARDVTEQRALQQQFLQAQRLEAVGRLAGGIAHDFNTLLTAISGYAEFLRGNLGEGHPGQRDVAEIARASERAAGLVAQLLMFSRRQILRPGIVDLNTVVESLAPMLERLLGEDAEIVTRLARGLPSITADPAQLEQLLVNLATNARDAMPQGGTLTISTAGAGPESELVRLAVTDTGTGMDEHTRLNAFEPFFTTKEQGKGTGLGLASVYGIVMQAGGSVRLESEPGRGTTVTVLFPATRAQAESSPPAQQDPPGAPGDETVLLVEDEDVVRILAARALRARGYVVLEARDGPGALVLADTHEGPVDLLLTDVVMPGMTGRELADAVIATRPALRVLYMSGYADDDVLGRGVPGSNVAFIAKPFTTAELATRVRELLDLAENEPGG
ncbi:MAG: PAS domain S-box protein [Thermoleophilia bacterium]|nr:PAS domain S-box protein [Thermoleophilia bacterium]